jgi:phage shock protein PspC (stress-responsive transcriptional regulator)
MNKVLNINLGGMPLTIDDDAYRHLENYLQSLHNHFRNSEGYEEIMSDIEARLGELLREGMGKRSIAGMQDVKNAVSIMGTPEDFGAESISETAEKAKTSSSSAVSSNTDSTSRSNREGGIKTGKRLFRDGENKMVGGVCSGLAAYFGINDPTWVRILLAVLGFTMGSGVLIYFVMWALIPEAKTTADRLAMQGESVDVNSIAKAVEEGAQSFSKKLNEFGNPENQARFNDGVHRISAKIGGVIQTLLKGMGGFWKILLAIVSVLVIISLFISWVSGIVSVVWAYPFFGYLSDSSAMPLAAILASFALVSIPITLLVLFLRRLFLQRPASNAVVGGLWTAWGLSWAILGIFGGRTVKDFNHKAEFTQTVNLSDPNVETLTLKILENPNGDLATQLGNIQVSEDYLIVEGTQIRIEKSESDKLELVKTVYSRGRNLEEARKLSNNLELKVESIGDKLTIANSFQIPKGTKYRGQLINLLLKVPVGKKIRFDKTEENGNINFREASDDNEDNEPCWENDISLWEMTEDGMKCLNKKRKE